MDTQNTNLALRMSGALAEFPAALATLQNLAQETEYPRTLRGQAAFCRQLLAGLAGHLTDPHIRRLAARLGAYSERPEDIEEISKLEANPLRFEEHALTDLILNALAPTPYWHGIDSLREGGRTEAGAFAIVLVVAALPRTAGPRRGH